jgi:hypothetical protein
MSPHHQYKAVQDLVTDGIRSGYLPDVYVSRLNGLYNRQTGYHNRNNALPAQLLLEQVIAETKKE